MSSNSLDVVIGAGSAIGRALIERWSCVDTHPIFAVARTEEALALVESLGVQSHQCDYSEAALAALATQMQEQSVDIRRLIICNGVLQGDGYRPERALNQLKTTAMEQVFEAKSTAKREIQVADFLFLGLLHIPTKITIQIKETFLTPQRKN